MLLSLRQSTFAVLCLCLFAGTAERAAAQQPGEKPKVRPALPHGARLRLGTVNLRHADKVWAVAFPATGDTLLSASRGPVRLWDLQTGQERRRYEQDGFLAVSPDGKTVALGWDVVHLVDVASGKELRQLPGHKGGILAAAFSPDGTTLVTGGDDRTIREWRVNTGKELRRLKEVHRDGL